MKKQKSTRKRPSRKATPKSKPSLVGRGLKLAAGAAALSAVAFGVSKMRKSKNAAREKSSWSEQAAETNGSRAPLRPKTETHSHERSPVAAR